jgi:hypothetical protein
MQDSFRLDAGDRFGNSSPVLDSDWPILHARYSISRNQGMYVGAKREARGDHIWTEEAGRAGNQYTALAETFT